MFEAALSPLSELGNTCMQGEYKALIPSRQNEREKFVDFSVLLSWNGQHLEVNA